MAACKNWTNYFVGPPICMFHLVRRTFNLYGGVQKLDKLLRRTSNCMFHLVGRTSNLYGGVQKLDKLLRRTSNLYGGVQQLDKLLIQFVINVLVIMFDPVCRTSNLY
jgi:hypothetical protein